MDFKQLGKGCGKQLNTFSSYHPVSLLIYFLCVVSIGMFVGNPVLAALFLAGSLCLYAFQGEKSFWKDIRFYILTFLLIALVNPLFSHNGRTVLFFLNGKPVTYEALAYGAVIAAVIVSTLCWFKSYGIIMTSDKLLYLFGHSVPKLSVVLSSALRYIPLFRRQTRKIRESQTALGLYSKGNFIDNAKGTARVFSIMVTWSLENAIDTADSMKAKGYGLRGRTQFSNYRFRSGDVILTVASVLLLAVTLYGIARGYADFAFYLKLGSVSCTKQSIIMYAAYGLLAFVPCFSELKESLQWNYCKSKI